MNFIEIGPDAKLSLESLIESRLFIQANSGGGKSWLIRRLLEQTHGLIQQIVIDPEGEFFTLREKFDYVLAGQGGDVPAEPHTAKQLARKLLELKTSAILDLYELKIDERQEFVQLFLESLVNAPKALWHPVLVIIDEAHMFAPQNGDVCSMDAVKDLMTRGRKREFCGVLATQRIASISKSVIADCNNKLIGRTGLDVDRKRAGEELGLTDKDETRALRNLLPGEFYMFGPSLSLEVKKIKVGPIMTAHGKEAKKLTMGDLPPMEHVKSALAELATIPVEMKQEEDELAMLRRQVNDLSNRPAALPDMGEVERLKKELEQVGENCLVYRDRLIAVEKNWDLYRKTISQISVLCSSVLSPDQISVSERFIKKVDRVTEEQRTTLTIPPKNMDGFMTISAKDVGPDMEDLLQKRIKKANKITGGAARMLGILSVTEESTKTDLAVMACMSHRSGSFSTYLSALKTRGLIEIVGDKVKLIGASNEPYPWKDSRELQQAWRERFSGGAQRMFDVLCSIAPPENEPDVAG